MKVTFLGVGGWIPTDSRSTTSLMVELEGMLILIDAGTGLYKLDRYKVILDKYTEIHLILSHYHLDHIIGLSYLPKFMKDKTLHIWGPGKPAYNESCYDILTKFTSQPYFSDTIDNFAERVEFHDYDTKGFFINGLKIGIHKQNHSSPSFAITLGSMLHFATDTDIDTFNFTTGCDLIIHECWGLTEEDAFGHTPFNRLKEMVSKHHVKRLWLCHINPKFTEETLALLNTDVISVIPEDETVLIRSIDNETSKY